MEKGAFPRAVPEWIASPVSGTGKTEVSGGLVGSIVLPTEGSTSSVWGNISKSPLTVAVKPAINPTSSEVGSPMDTQKLNQEQDSPLHRISRICPSLEAEVSKAILTTETNSRIAEYQRLSSLCPGSYDIWFWLAKDYLKVSNFTAAKLALEQVINLNSKHEEAKVMLDRLSKDLKQN